MPYSESDQMGDVIGIGESTSTAITRANPSFPYAFVGGILFIVILIIYLHWRNKK